MRANFTHTRLLVDDVKTCFKFYKDVLGLKSKLGDDCDIYAEFEAGSHTLALFSRKLMEKALGEMNVPVIPRPGESLVVCMDVPSVDESYKLLQSKGVEFITKPHDQPDWMIRVAHFRDPDGNVIEINQPLKSE